MDLIKKHIDTTVILASVLTACLWMNGKFNEVEKEIALLNKEMAVIKAVLIMKNIMPSELAKAEKKNE